MSKPVDGYEGLYEVDDTGHVWALRSGTPKPMHPYGKNGYLAVNLFRNGKYSHKYVHRLVAEAFLPNPRDLPVINHKNGDKHDNRVDNLEWCTQQANIDHSWRHGLQHGVGEGHGMHKLTEDDVRAIRREYVKGSTNHGTRALGEKYGVAQCTVSAIINRRIWKEVV